jgi:hypothetical protein
MADTSLILHVKGTEAETAVLPKDVVRAGISEGKITHSQLIWIPGENTWKQVKELPDLLPGESLILHVKGTEAETQQLPKHQVKAGISEGKITHSQLIWIPSENTWKPVRELPDLLPGETLILHVKGTEAETKQLPKQAVQAGVSKGQITHSQLIWIPNEQTWKPVRELPDLLPGERLILHVKGTESDTTELPRQAIRTALSKGQITHSQLIWSPNEHAWKQVREIPELLPSQKLAPAPSRETLHATPRIVDGIIPESPGGPVARAIAASGDIPKVRVAPADSNVPQVAVAAGAATPHVRVAGSPPKVIPKIASAATPQVRIAESSPEQGAQIPVAATVPHVRVAVASSETLKVRVKAAAPTARVAPVAARMQEPVDHRIADDSGSHPLKWVCIGLGVLILLVLAGNYLLVDQPLTSNLAKTHYSGVTVYAHLGAFMQPNVLVIHIPPSASVTPETLTDFLVTLAHSTPDSPLTGEPFARVALTSGWTGQYSFSGYSWKELGDMANQSEDQRKEDIMTRMDYANGQSILPESTMNQEAQQAQRDVIWGAFVAQFAKAH